MASVREHMTQHDDPDELPLLTESARVTDVTALDENRSVEVRRAAARILDELGRGDLVDETDDPPDDEDPPAVDWDGVTALLDGGDGGPIEERLSSLAERYHRAYPSLLSIALHESEEPIDFLPGQYVTVRFHETPRPYSVASSPTQSDLEFCVRRVPGGRLTSDLFEDLDTGDEVTVRGPNGEFVLGDPSSRDLAFMATGTGVAPLRSMIRYAFEEGLDVHDGEPRDVWLFLGCSWRDDLPYRDEFRRLGDEHDNFHFVPTLSREGYLTDWCGETAYVQETFVKYLADDVAADLAGDLATFRDESPATDVEARIDPGSLEVYACGVSAMVETLVDVVTAVGVPERRVEAEGYG
ncbi:MAG: FAD-binding oxidoreductase [Halobacteriaceae archaeon]